MPTNEKGEPQELPAFATWIAARRKELGLNQRQAARRCGVSFQQWSRYENGTRPRRGSICAMAVGLQLNLDEIAQVFGFPLTTLLEVTEIRDRTPLMLLELYVSIKIEDITVEEARQRIVWNYIEDEHHAGRPILPNARICLHLNRENTLIGNITTIQVGTLDEYLSNDPSTILRTVNYASYQGPEIGIRFTQIDANVQVDAKITYSEKNRNAVLEFLEALQTFPRVLVLTLSVNGELARTRLAFAILRETNGTNTEAKELSPAKLKEVILACVNGIPEDESESD